MVTNPHYSTIPNRQGPVAGNGSDCPGSLWVSKENQLLSASQKEGLSRDQQHQHWPECQAWPLGSLDPRSSNTSPTFYE